MGLMWIVRESRESSVRPWEALGHGLKSFGNLQRAVGYMQSGWKVRLGVRVDPNEPP